MSDRWALVEVDARAGLAPVDAPPDATHVLVTLWWGPLALGRQVLRSTQFPVSAAHLAQRVGEAAALVTAARSLPQRALRPDGNGEADASALAPTAARLSRNSSRPNLDNLLRARATEEPPPNISVVLCTRGADRSPAATVAALREQTVSPTEIVIVDNNDVETAELRALADGDGMVFVHEPEKGLSNARNAGIRASSGDVLAFTDDDAQPHPSWIAALGHAFADDPDVWSVTGLILPEVLDTPAAVRFELDRHVFGTGFLPIVFDPQWLEATAPSGAPVWAIGAGANMAIRREAFAMVGLFDPRLGAGAAGCSEDSELWYRVLAAGGRCRYEPAAIVHHTHRGSRGELRSQLGAYMEGHAAALIAQADRHGHDGNLHRLRRTLPKYYGGEMLRSIRHRNGHVGLEHGSEIAGLARGRRYANNAEWRANNEVPQL